MASAASAWRGRERAVGSNSGTPCLGHERTRRPDHLCRPPPGLPRRRADARRPGARRPALPRRARRHGPGERRRRGGVPGVAVPAGGRRGGGGGGGVVTGAGDGQGSRRNRERRTAASTDGRSGSGSRPGMLVRPGGPVPPPSVSGIFTLLECPPRAPTAGSDPEWTFAPVIDHRAEVLCVDSKPRRMHERSIVGKLASPMCGLRLSPPRLRCSASASRASVPCGARN